LEAGIMKSHFFKTKLICLKKTGIIDVISSFIRREKILFSTWLVPGGICSVKNRTLKSATQRML